MMPGVTTSAPANSANSVNEVTAKTHCTIMNSNAGWPSLRGATPPTVEPSHMPIRITVSSSENVARLDALPPAGFRVIALPLKIRDGTGAPLRIVALLESGESP